LGKLRRRQIAIMTASESFLRQDDPRAPGHRQLYAFLDELKKEDLDLGATDYARLDRVLLLLTARGIALDTPEAGDWLAPVLCGSPSEQTMFHERFRKHVERNAAKVASPAPLTPAERAVVDAPAREARLRRWLFIGVVVVVGVVALTIATYSLTSLGQQGPESSIPKPEITFFIPSPDLSTGLLSRPLALIPLLLALLFVQWHRSRQLMLLRAFAPAPEKAEKVAFATAQPRFYGEPAVKRALGALRTHWAAPGRSLDVRRSIRATLRAGGRPELRFGNRPRTPEYVFLVDREAPRDHLSAAASLLMTQLIEERIVVTRYDYFGDPRRVVRPAEASGITRHLRLADLGALHTNATILMFTDASTFFDTSGRARRWLTDLREWGRPVLLTPRAVENWDWTERELEVEGVLVIPASKEGLEAFAERLKLGPDVPLYVANQARETGIDRAALSRTHRGGDVGKFKTPEGHFDLAAFLDRQRHLLLDDASPPPAVVAELLADLQISLGPQTFALLQALAVFPRLEPALTIHLGMELTLYGRPLLDEQRLLAIARLPWLRAGHMPDWLRRALVRRIEKERMAAILDVLQSFLLPIENPRAGVISLEIGRRSGQGFRQLLLRWIGHDQTGELQDRILVDALRGLDPEQLGVPVPETLGRQLQDLFRTREWVVLTLAGALSALFWLVHASLIDLLRWIWDLSGGQFLDVVVQGLSTPLLAAGWGALLLALELSRRSSRDTASKESQRDSRPLTLCIGVIPIAVVVIIATFQQAETPQSALAAAVLAIASLLVAMVIALTNRMPPDVRPQIATLLCMHETLWSKVATFVLLFSLFSLLTVASIALFEPGFKIWSRVLVFVAAEGLGLFIVYLLLLRRIQDGLLVSLRRADFTNVRMVSAVLSAGQAILPLAFIGVFLLWVPLKLAGGQDLTIIAVYLHLRFLSGLFALSLGMTPPVLQGTMPITNLLQPRTFLLVLFCTIQLLLLVITGVQLEHWSDKLPALASSIGFGSHLLLLIPIPVIIIMTVSLAQSVYVFSFVGPSLQSNRWAILNMVAVPAFIAGACLLLAVLGGDDAVRLAAMALGPAAFYAALLWMTPVVYPVAASSRSQSPRRSALIAQMRVRILEAMPPLLVSVVVAAGAALVWLTDGFIGGIGSALATVFLSLGGICSLIASLIYRRYVGVLGAGAQRKGTSGRLSYDTLRKSLSEGNLAARFYASRLSAFLDSVDRFFGDAGLADRTLFPRAFGLNAPAPLWTAPAFDRCLQLALLSLIAMIYLIWAESGYVGPAEAALNLRPDLPAWRRALTVAAVALTVVACWRFTQTKEGQKFLAASAGVILGAGSVVAAGTATSSVAIIFAGTATYSFGGPFGGAVAFAVVLSVAVAFNIALAIVGAVAFAGAVAFVVAVVVLNDSATRHQWQGVFLSLFFISMMVACLGAASLLSPLTGWEEGGPTLLFLGLLTLLNAPFGWASLGLTRALLRRGLELGAWWPFLLALAGAVLAGVIVAALAVTMVIGVQAFDSLAVHGGGNAVLPLNTLFDGIAAHPAGPENWWLYALLLSTVIPSMINLIIGGASLLRGVPGLSPLLLQFMPVGRAVPAFDRAWIALVLTLQVVVGALLGIAAQALLVLGVIGYVMPWLGLGLFDLARNVAAFNLPLRLGQLFGGIL
jgi:hypothetical protein